MRIFTTSIFKLSGYGYYHDHFQFLEYQCRIIWTIHYQFPPLSSKEGADSEVVKLFPDIGLESMDGATELSGDVGEKGG